MSVLNDITYNNDIMNMQSTGLADTPAKLKLRANAFGNIRKAMQAKQTVEPAKADFHIPGAYMAMDINGGDDSGNGGVTLVDSNLENQFPMNSPMTKRLKIKDQQFQALHAAQETSDIENSAVSYETNSDLNSVEATPSMDQFNESSRITDASNVDFGDTIDPFTDGMVGMQQPNEEHVYEATPILSPEEKAQKQTEVAFSKLTATTTSYGNVCAMTAEAESELKKLQDELKKLDNQKNKKERAVGQAQGKVSTRLEMLKEREQQKEAAIDMVYQLNQSIFEQTAYMQGLTNKKEDELQEIRDKVEKVKAQILERQNEISVKNNQLENLKNRERQLNDQEKAIFSCYEDILKSLDESKKQFEAIPVPENSELVEETETSKKDGKVKKEDEIEEEEIGEDVITSEAEIIDFPSDGMRNEQDGIKEGTADVIDFSDINFNEDITEEGPTMVRSIGTAA